MKVSLLVQTETAAYPWESTANSFQIGRSMDCALVLTGADCPGVSGHHVKFEFSTQGLTVWDLKSRNGTFVNGRRIQAPQPLQLGDVVSLGWQGPKLKITDIEHPSMRFRTVAANPSAVPLAPTVLTPSMPPGAPQPVGAPSAMPYPVAATPLRPPPVGQPPPAARVASQLRAGAPGAQPVQQSTPTRMLLLNLASRHRRVWFMTLGLGGLLAVALAVILVVVLTKPNETIVGDSGNKGDKSAIYRKALKHACAIGFRQGIGGQLPFNGSGSVFNQERRLIVTNYHVVHMWNSASRTWKRPPEVAVYFPKYGPDGKVISDLQQYRSNSWHVMGKILTADQNLDLAVVQVPALPDTIRALSMADSSPDVGQRVFLVGGNPLGSGNATWTFGDGIVRSVAKDTIRYGDQPNSGVVKLTLTAKIIRSSIPSNPGDSGAGIVNDDGRLVGVNTGKAPGDGNRLHIDITNVREFLSRHGYLE